MTRSFRQRLLSSILSDQWYPIVLTISFLFGEVFVALYHEMGGDEIHPWLVARDSTSLSGLFHQLRWDGHPALWYVLLMPFTRMTSSPIIMQPLHLLIAAVTVWAFTKFSPFTRFQKLLFAFGYFPAYEYSIIPRNYAPAVLLLFLFATLFPKRHSHFILLALILFLLCHVNVLGLILVIAIVMALMCEIVLHNRGWSFSPTVYDRKQVLFGLVIIAGGIGSAVLQLVPASDSAWTVPGRGGWFLHYDTDRLNKVMRAILSAQFMIPSDERILRFLQSVQTVLPVLVTHISEFVRIALSSGSAILFGSVIALLWLRITPLIIYAGGTLGLLSFFYTKYYFGAYRHHGFLFIVFVVAVWIWKSVETTAPIPFGARNSRFQDKWLTRLLTCTLIIHLIFGLNALRRDYQHPYSNAKAAADYLRASGFEKLQIVGDPDFTTNAIVGYLEKDRIYYVRGDRFGSFPRYDLARNQEVSDGKIVEKAKELLAKANTPQILVIVDHPIPQSLVEPGHLSQLASFTGSLLGDDFYIYLLES